MSRVLAVDYGDVRTGLALSDENRFLASGIGTICEGGMRATAKRVAAVAAEPRGFGDRDRTAEKYGWFRRGER